MQTHLLKGGKEVVKKLNTCELTFTLGESCWDKTDEQSMQKAEN